MARQLKSQKPHLSLYEFFWYTGTISGCHQLPERSFFIGGKQFPICARCTGCFIGYIIGIITYFFYKIPIPVCVSLCAIMLIDWLIQYFGIRPSTNLRRIITGTICGVGWIQLHLYLYCFIGKGIYSFIT